jgi:hypothetical protein
MTLTELTSRIDREIAEKKENGKNMWFDHDISIEGIRNELRNYYIEKGYEIELMPCRSCLGARADIIISWVKGL